MDAAHDDETLRALGNPDEELRRVAVEALAGRTDGEALSALVERLGDASWRVRKAAIDAFAATPRPEPAVRALVGALADGENPGRRNAALEALTRCGAAAVGPLLDAADDPDVDVRKQVVDALAGIGDPAAAPRLRALLGDADANVRAAAADAVAAVGCDEGAPSLLRAAAEDPEPLVRLSALRALSRLEVACAVDDLSGPLEDPLLRPAALALLGASDDPAAEDRLLKGLAEGGRAVRDAAMEAVVRLAGRRDDADAERLAERVRDAARATPELVAAAAEGLERGALPQRLVAVQFLGLAREEASVVPLLQAGLDEALGEVVLGALAAFGDGAARAVDGAWDDLSPRLRSLACDLLGRLSEGPGVERLRGALGDPDPGLRAAAAQALGRRRFEPALGELVAQLEAAASREDEVGEEVADALTAGIMGIAASGTEVAERAMELLASRLEGAGEPFRLAVARILGEIGRSGQTERLGLLMADPSAAVRRAAVEALARLAGGRTPEPLRLALADESASVRIGAAGALAKTGDPGALEDLAALAGDEEDRVRAAAMRAVGAWAAGAPQDGRAAFPRLEPLLAAGLAEGGPVAMAALETLACVGGAEAVAMARRLLGASDPELAQGAIACVGTHGGDDDLAELVPLASHPNWTVRAQAVQALGARAFAQALPALRRRREVEQDEFVRDALDRVLARLEGCTAR